jgi:hypothetical protein
MQKHHIINSICFLLSFLFVYTAVSKLISYPLFTLQVSQSPFMYPFAKWVAAFVPISEMLMVILLASSRTRLYGLYGTVFLMTLFTAYIAAMLMYSDYLPCSCGGILETLSWKWHIVVNSCFLVLAITGLYLQTWQQVNVHSTPILTKTQQAACNKN